jgi:outer membrane lipoprotein SlyB
MARLALSAVAIAALAGCSTYYEAPPRGPVSTTTGAPVVSSSSTVAPAPVAPAAVSSAAPAAVGPYRAGNGIIESIGLVTLPPAGWPASAAAGGTVPPAAPGPYRVTLRMDDGTIQTLMQDTRALLVGDRIHLSADGRLSRP